MTVSGAEALGRASPGAVVHVLPKDLARGAQVFARALRDRLDGEGGPHRTVTLFRGPAGALEPDHRLDVPEGPLRRVGFDPRVVPRLRRLLRELSPNVVVAHGGEPLKYCAAALPAGTRLVALKIGSGHESLRRGTQARLHRWLLRRADRVVAVSQDVADEAVSRLGCDPGRVVVIPNGRDPELYQPAGDRPRPTRTGAVGARDRSESAVRMIYVGHLEPPKRPLWFVDVVRRLAADQPGLGAVMVGDGPLIDEVRQAARDLPIEVLGRRDDVPALLAGSDVLVLPSEREGMPGVLVEAGLAGIPSVTTAVSGAHDVVDDGVTGHVVPVDDLDRLTERVAELVADPAHCSAMGQAARRRCLERFSLDAVAQAWSVLLAELGAGSTSSQTSPAGGRR